MVFFDKWGIQFKEDMDTSPDQTFAEVLEVQLNPLDIGQDECKNINYTYMLQLILNKKAEVEEEEQKLITIHKRITKIGKLVSLNVSSFILNAW